MAAEHGSTGRGWLELKVLGPVGLAEWQSVWVELRFDVSVDDDREGPPRPSDRPPKDRWRSELQVFEVSQQKVESEKVLATQRLEALEAEFAAFKKQENPEMGLEEYGMLERSFNQRIQRERDYWDNLDANSIPMRTFPLQTGDYNVAAVPSRNQDMFKVGNLRKEMVFRAKNTEDRDDWMNRFSLGQIKNRLMSNTGILASALDSNDWPRDASVDPREKVPFHAKFPVLEKDFNFLGGAHDPVYEDEEEEDVMKDIEDADYQSPARAGSPSSPVTTEHVGEGGRAEDGDHLKRSQRPDTQDEDPPSEEKQNLELFWQRRSLFAVPPQLWLNPAYDGLIGLYLDRNAITELPEQCAKFRLLKTLSIADNQLTEFPDWIGSLSRLETIAAPRNKIKHLPETLGNLHGLCNLNVFGNQISKIPIRLGNCGALKTLNFRNNLLEPLTPEDEAGFETFISLPSDILDLINQGRVDNALMRCLEFWQRRLEEYYVEQERLEETREWREAEAERLAREEKALGWKRELLRQKSVK